MNPKQRAAEAAIPLISSGMAVGLGTGSTADFFLLALGEAIRDGRLRDICGVATSRQSEHRAEELGIPLTSLSRRPVLDLTVDGADEIDPHLNLIKGLGGALIREKIVAQNSKQLIIIADGSKRVDYLGQKAPLPVEVVSFAHEAHVDFFKSLGADPVLRKTGGMIFNTDNGNLIYDCRFSQPIDAVDVEAKLRTRAGIVGTGLFMSIARTVFIADDDRVERRDRS